MYPEPLQGKHHNKELKIRQKQLKFIKFVTSTLLVRYK